MSRELIHRLLRRGVVLGATVAVIGVAMGTVKVAADWRAADAPLDAAPVGVETINAQLVAETDRASVLAEEIDAVASEIAGLRAAVVTADAQVTDDAAGAEALQARLDAAGKKLRTLQDQLRTARDRLGALNRAAQRQAAANSAPRSTSSGSREDDHHEDEEDEEDHGD
jgi:septal ring factor EnvC (AmiA/AmiB activator)